MGGPRHRGRGAIAAAASLFLGTGLGLALAGRTRRGFAWLGAAAVSALLILITPWSLLLLIAAHVGSAVDSYLVARHSEQPLSSQTWGPAAIFVTAVMGLIALQTYVIEAFKIPASAMYPTLVIGDHIYVNKLALLWRAPARGEIIAFKYPCDGRRDYVKRVVALPGESVEVRCNILYVNGTAVPQTLVTEHTSYMDYEEYNGSWYEHSVSRYREVLGRHPHDLFSRADRPETERHPAKDGDERDFPRHGATPSCTDDADGTAEQSAHIHQVLGTIVETKADSSNGCEPQAHYVVPPAHVFVLGDNRSNSSDSRVWGSVPLANVKGIVSSIWLSDGLRFELGRFGRVE